MEMSRRKVATGSVKPIQSGVRSRHTAPGEQASISRQQASAAEFAGGLDPAKKSAGKYEGQKAARAADRLLVAGTVAAKLPMPSSSRRPV